MYKSLAPEKLTVMEQRGCGFNSVKGFGMLVDIDIYTNCVYLR